MNVFPFSDCWIVAKNGLEPVKGAPLLGAAKRALDGEDRSEMIVEFESGTSCLERMPELGVSSDLGFAPRDVILTAASAAAGRDSGPSSNSNTPKNGDR